MIQSRFYNVRGARWEARFFAKGETFPESDAKAVRQGIWARPVSSRWDQALFVGHSWASVQLDLDLLYFPEAK
ncbi:MAG: hypothetical protein HY913_13790 [Desulfomonile tiedjei]|nr:hypothetical protein [Desulfomonile tiedjei]